MHRHCTSWNKPWSFMIKDTLTLFAKSKTSHPRQTLDIDRHLHRHEFGLGSGRS